MILTLVGVSHGTLDQSAQRARGVGADIWFRPPGVFGDRAEYGTDERQAPGAAEEGAARNLCDGDDGSAFVGLRYGDGIDLEDFRRLNGGFHFLQGGPLVNDDDMVVG